MLQNKNKVHKIKYSGFLFRGFFFSKNSLFDQPCTVLLQQPIQPCFSRVHMVPPQERDQLQYQLCSIYAAQCRSLLSTWVSEKNLLPVPSVTRASTKGFSGYSLSGQGDSHTQFAACSKCPTTGKATTVQQH